MEEAHLLKERFLAITEKKKLREDIANKRAEIDEEKLKFQYLKKKALREQWLMEGQGDAGGQGAAGGQGHEAARQQMQNQQEEIRALQSNIHRMEKEVEALEREEIIISTNEAFILKRLKAIEKTPEEIIQAAKCESFKEPAPHARSTPNIVLSHGSLHSKTHSPGPDVNKQIPAVIATEINVQNDSQILSTASITPQRFQQNGVRACNDERRTVSAINLGGGDFHRGVDDLSPVEVKQLLRTSHMHTSRTVPECRELGFPNLCNTSPSLWRPEAEQVRLESNGLQGLNESINYTNPEFIYSDSGQVWNSRCHSPLPDITLYAGLPETQFPQSARHSSKSSLKSRENQEGRHNQNSKHRPHDSGDTFHIDPGRANQNPPLDLYDSKGDFLNTTPAHLDFSKPVTMIFMGYQRVSNDEAAQDLGYDGTIRAELVVIASDEDESGDRGVVLQPGRSPGARQHPTAPQTTCGVTSTIPPLDSGHFQEAVPSHPPISSPDRMTDGSVVEDASTTGSKKINKGKKLCCSLM